MAKKDRFVTSTTVLSETTLPVLRVVAGSKSMHSTSPSCREHGKRTIWFRFSYEKSGFYLDALRTYTRKMKKNDERAHRDSGAVLDQPRDDDELAWVDLHVAVSELHQHRALGHKKKLVFIVVMTAMRPCNTSEPAADTVSRRSRRPGKISSQTRSSLCGGGAGGMALHGQAYCQSNSPSSFTILTCMPFTSPTILGLQWSLNLEKPSVRLTNVQLDESVIGSGQVAEATPRDE